MMHKETVENSVRMKCSLPYLRLPSRLSKQNNERVNEILYDVSPYREGTSKLFS